MEDCGHIPVWTGQRVERTNARGRHTYCAPFKTWIIEQAIVAVDRPIEVEGRGDREAPIVRLDAAAARSPYR